MAGTTTETNQAVEGLVGDTHGRGSGMSRTRFAYRCAMTAAAAAMAVSTAAPATAAQEVGQRAAGEQFSFRLHEAVRELPLAQEDRTGYVRSKFKHWVDEDHVIWSQVRHIAA